MMKDTVPDSQMKSTWGKRSGRVLSREEGLSHGVGNSFFPLWRFRMCSNLLAVLLNLYF